MIRVGANDKFFKFKEGSRHEKGFTAICCTCDKESSVAWGINSSLTRHLTTKGHDGLLDEYKALQQENPQRGMKRKGEKHHS